MNAPTLPNPEQAEDQIPGAGHNMPPADPAYDAKAFAESTKKADDFMLASNVWLQTPITSETLAGQLTDQIAGLRKVYKDVDDQRKSAKSVWDTKGQAVQDAFNPILVKLKTAADKLKAPLLAWTQEQQRIADEARAEKIRLANEAAAEARRLAMDAEAANSISAQVEAEAAAKAAEKQVKAASKEVRASVKSGSGGGRTLSTRTRNVCTIDRIAMALAYYRNEPRLAELLVQLANAEANAKDFDLRAGHSIPGFTITEIQSIA